MGIGLLLAAASFVSADLIPAPILVVYPQQPDPEKPRTDVQYSCKMLGPHLYAVTEIKIKITPTKMLVAVTQNGQTKYVQEIVPEAGKPSVRAWVANSCPNGGYAAHLRKGDLSPESGWPTEESLRAHALAGPLPSGQASQRFELADVNGDGEDDFLSLVPSGLQVQLLAGDGSTISTQQFPVGFSPGAYDSELIAGDFNGDGKVDVAVSYYGSSSTNLGGAVFILLGNGDGTFSAPKSSNAGANPLSLAAADFNGDGKLDIVAGNLNVQNVTLLLGNGDGTFQAPVTYATGAGTFGLPRSIVAADFNGDGAPDVAVANRNDNSVSVLLNTGGGKLGQPVVTALGFDPEYLAYSDFNHDGKLDLAVAGEFENALIMLLGNGNGTFQAPAVHAVGDTPQSLSVVPLDDGNTMLAAPDNITGDVIYTVVSPDGTVNAARYNIVPGSPGAIATGDLNGDGQPDVVVTGGSDPVSVMIAQLGTQFRAPVGYPLDANSSNPRGVAIGDLNGDGKPDVIVSAAGGPASVSVLLGSGDGTLRPAQGTSLPLAGVENLVLGDFNRDGKLDVAVASDGGASDGGVEILLGNGDGTFRAPVAYTVAGLHAQAVVAVDVNGDGKLDLAAIMLGTFGQPGTLAVFLGQGDGTFAAARTLPLKIFAMDIAAGDLNGDGKPDLAAGGGNSVDILLGDGAGGFRELPTLVQTNFAAQKVVVADLDGDGKPDLIVADAEGIYFLGNGDGTFQAGQYFVSGQSPVAMALTRFSGGAVSGPRPDLVILDQGGRWISAVNGFPSAAEPAASGPADGSGSAQTFTFTFSDADGYQNLSVVDVLIASALDGRRACYVAFVPSGAGSGSVFLVDDAGDAGGPYQGLVLPGSGTISNGQCSINGAGSSVAGAGNALTLKLAMTFTAAFAGNKVIYLAAQDKTGNNSGWQALGTWGIMGPASAGPSVGGVNPPQSGSAAQTYTFTFTDTNGWQDIAVANVLINTAIDGRTGCYVAMVPSGPSGGSVFLVDDAGDAGDPYAGIVLPGNGTASNSQCTIGGPGSFLSGSGNTLAVTLPIAFSVNFTGDRVFFLAARSNALNSGWQAVGTVSVP